MLPTNKRLARANKQAQHLQIPGNASRQVCHFKKQQRPLDNKRVEVTSFRRQSGKNEQQQRQETSLGVQKLANRESVVAINDAAQFKEIVASTTRELFPEEDEIRRPAVTMMS